MLPLNYLKPTTASKKPLLLFIIIENMENMNWFLTGQYFTAAGQNVIVFKNH